MSFLGHNSIGDTFGFLLDRFGWRGLWDVTVGSNRSWLLFMQRFLNYFMNRFEYDGLPEESEDVTFRNAGFERWLFFTPAVSIFKDDKLGVQVLPVAGWNSERDIAGFPKSWEVTAGNGYKKELTRDNAVLMFNDKAYSIPFLHILYEMQFMIEIDNTHRQNIRALRQPLIMEITEDEKKSAEEFIRRLAEFDDTIKVRRRVGERSAKSSSVNDAMKVFNSGAVPVGDELNKDFVSFENRIFTYLGLNNVTFEKKERMLTGELSQNDQVVQSNFTNAYMCRKQAIDAANKLFGTSITIKPAKYLAPDTDMVNTQAQNFERGGGDNGSGVSSDGDVR